MFHTIGYKGLNPNHPELDATKIVAGLLNDMHQAAHNRDMQKHQKASDELAVFTKAYLLPAEPEFWRGIGLTPGERIIADLLHTKLNGVIRRDTIMNALYFDRPEDEPDQKIIDVFISKMRPKVKAAGYEILCIHRVGYRMVPVQSKIAA